MDEISIVNFLKLFLFVLIFSHAAYTDWKSRKVLKYIWYPAILVGLVSIYLDFTQGNFDIIEFSIGLLIVSLILVALSLTDTGLGDYKAIITLFILFPFQPSVLYFPLYSPVSEMVNNGARPFILIVIENSSLIALLYPVYNLLYNKKLGHDINFKSLVMVEKKIENVSDSEGWIDFEEHDKIFIDDIRKICDKNNMRVQNVIRFIEDKPSVWIETGIPLVTAITIGAMLSIIFGISPIDLVYYHFA